MKRSFFGPICVLAVIALFVALTRWALQPTTERMQKVYADVRTAAQFSIGGVGIANTMSQEEVAFRELLAQPQSIARCKRLLTEATPPGQMYGLLGLRLLEKQAFQAALLRYKDVKTNVTTTSGCLVMNDTASNIACQIEQGQFK